MKKNSEIRKNKVGERSRVSEIKEEHGVSGKEISFKERV